MIGTAGEVVAFFATSTFRSSSMGVEDQGICRLASVWPEWKVEEEIGEGTFGKVYRVAHEEHGVTSASALKVISIPQKKAELSSLRSEGMDGLATHSYLESVVTAFVNEIKMMESMKGTSNIVNVEDYKVLERSGEIGWDIFIRMELLTSFNAYSKDKRLTEAEVIKLGIDICSALELCNKLNIIHRDIKPGNIFVSPFGDFKIGDFGIARQLEKTSGALSYKGTSNYMAPEMAKAERYNSSVDIYSLGLVLFKLLNNNRLPFLDPYSQTIQYDDRKRAIEIRNAGEPLSKPVGASPQMAQVILMACAYDPAKRFASPTAFKNALSAINGSVMATVLADAPDAADGGLAMGDDLDKTAEVRRASEDNGDHPEPSDDGTSTATLSKQREKMSRATMILIAVGAVIVVAAITVGMLFVLYSINPVTRVVDSLESGDYDSALSYAGNANSSDLENQMSKRLDKIVTDFQNGTIDYSVASMELGTIEKMNIPTLADKLNNDRATVDNLNASTTAFNTAEAMYANGDYANAITQYKLVIDDDPNYNAAIDGIQEATDAYSAQALSTASALARNNDYPGAVSSLESALSVVPNDPDLTQQLTIYQANIDNTERQTALDDAAQAADNNDLAKAINILSDALQTSPNDEQLKQQLTTYQDAYVKDIISQATDQINQNKQDDARKLVYNALQVVPGNADLAAELKTIESSRPVNLSSVVLIDSSNYGLSTDLLIDSFGNNYTESLYFYRASYAIYNLNGKYKSLLADLVAPQGLNPDAVFSVFITLDEGVTPIKTINNYTAQTGKIHIDVDVTSAKELTITVKASPANKSDAINLVNATLTK